MTIFMFHRSCDSVNRKLLVGKLHFLYLWHFSPDISSDISGRPDVSTERPGTTCGEWEHDFTPYETVNKVNVSGFKCRR